MARENAEWYTLAIARETWQKYGTIWNYLSDVAGIKTIVSASLCQTRQLQTWPTKKRGFYTVRKKLVEILDVYGGAKGIPIESFYAEKGEDGFGETDCPAKFSILYKNHLIIFKKAIKSLQYSIIEIDGKSTLDAFNKEEAEALRDELEFIPKLCRVNSRMRQQKEVWCE